jgi:hypothetical protein
VKIAIGQKKPEVLYLIRDYLGMGTVGSNGTPNSFRLTICGQKNVRKFIRLVYPYSVVKKDQLRVAYAMTELIGRPSVNRELRDKLHHQLKDLKR